MFDDITDGHYRLSLVRLIAMELIRCPLVFLLYVEGRHGHCFVEGGIIVQVEAIIHRLND